MGDLETGGRRAATVLILPSFAIPLLASCLSTNGETSSVSTAVLTYARTPEVSIEATTAVPTAPQTRQPSVPADGSGLGLPLLAQDVFFVDAIHGWILGIRPADAARTQWDVVLAQTNDGGASWVALPMPPAPAWQEGQGSEIFFSDEHRGWLFVNQTYPRTSALYSTEDGGRNWREESPRGAIVEMIKTLNGEIWALEQFEDPTEWRVLRVANAGYADWPEAELAIPQVVAPDDFIRQDPYHTWVSHWTPHPASEGADVQVFDLALLLSTDGGQSWEDLATPCGGFLGGTEFNASVAGVGNSQLWMGCGEAAGAGSGTKYVYFSRDGGRTWQNRGSSEDGAFSSAGGYFRGLNAVSDDFVYMTWRRSESILLSRDGGMTWQDLHPACESESVQAIFVDPSTGWAYGNTWDFEHICLSRTSDGGRTWQCRYLPENESCARP